MLCRVTMLKWQNSPSFLGHTTSITQRALQKLCYQRGHISDHVHIFYARCEISKIIFEPVFKISLNSRADFGMTGL